MRPSYGIPTTTTGHVSSSITFVLVLSTLVAVCGSFCYGCSVGYSSPAQSGIMEDLGLSVAAYSVFGSIVTIGGMMGAIASGKIADLVGRKRTMCLSQLFCAPGWFAIALAKVPVYVAEITPKDLRGRFTLANTIVHRSRRKKSMIRGKKVDVSHEANEIRDAIEKFEHTPGAKAWDLFQKRNFHPIIVGVGLMSLQQFGGISGVKYYAKTIFAETGFSPTIGTTAFSVIQIPLAAIGLLLMDISGRRALLMISSAGECLFLFFVVLSFLLQKLQVLKELTPVLASAGLMGYGGMFALGMSGIPWVIMSEIFPLNVKASAGSLVTLTNWTCSWVVTYAINFMIEWSPAETKGRTLEEIQASITRFYTHQDLNGSLICLVLCQL
ncbi:hypothetical protein Tsubulata_005824 [Turnera subulata]|uniref:Major facilitator superfamily (MFS) profile domain-containing protein n=1 Tax=Turnera subulata TaxID=218843 RepID=A0A9Q0GIS0_9ROSI|nr:hypothetical protein Tsubulata_005824 [Turnera subulata]